MMKKLRKFGADWLDVFKDLRVWLVLGIGLIVVLQCIEYMDYSGMVAQLADQIDRQQISEETGRFILDAVTYKLFVRFAVMLGLLLLIGIILIFYQVMRNGEPLFNIDLRLWEMERMMRLSNLMQENLLLEQKQKNLRDRLNDLQDEWLEEEQAMEEEEENEEDEPAAPGDSGKNRGES